MEVNTSLVSRGGPGTDNKEQGEMNILLGIFFIVLSFCFVPKKSRYQKNIYEQKENCSNWNQILESLPVSGICKLILTGVSIILLVSIASADDIGNDDESIICLSHATIYISFSISGLLDILMFYMTKDIFPKHSETFSLLIAFLVEYSAFSTNMTEENSRLSSFCLLIAIRGCLVSSVMMILSNRFILSFSLVLFTQIQGTWLIHSAFLSSNDNLTFFYFSWHIIAVFTSILVINVVMQLQTRTDQERHETTKHDRKTVLVGKKASDSYSGLTVLHNIVKSDNDIKEGNVKNVVEDDLDTSVESVPTQIISVSSDHGERMSPLEEFNTLYRHSQSVRKSIKLKESSIV